jgi:hypothetical protein
MFLAGILKSHTDAERLDASAAASVQEEAVADATDVTGEWPSFVPQASRGVLDPATDEARYSRSRWA